MILLSIHTLASPAASPSHQPTAKKADKKKKNSKEEVKEEESTKPIVEVEAKPAKERVEEVKVKEPAVVAAKKADVVEVAPKKEKNNNKPKPVEVAIEPVVAVDESAEGTFVVEMCFYAVDLNSNFSFWHYYRSMAGEQGCHQEEEGPPWLSNKDNRLTWLKYFLLNSIWLLVMNYLSLLLLVSAILRAQHERDDYS